MSGPDGQGGQLPTVWIDYFDFMAKVEWTRGGEKEVAGGVQAYDNCKITSYYDGRVDPSMRLKINGQIINIRSMSNVEERFLVMEIKGEKGVGT